jgi:hypothetical protein
MCFPSYRDEPDGAVAPTGGRRWSRGKIGESVLSDEEFRLAGDVLLLKTVYRRGEFVLTVPSPSAVLQLISARCRIRVNCTDLVDRT